MFTNLSPALFLDQKVKVDIRVWKIALCDESSIVVGLVLQLFHLECDKFFGIFEMR